MYYTGEEPGPDWTTTLLVADGRVKINDVMRVAVPYLWRQTTDKEQLLCQCPDDRQPGASFCTTGIRVDAFLRWLRRQGISVDTSGWPAPTVTVGDDGRLTAVADAGDLVVRVLISADNQCEAQWLGWDCGDSLQLTLGFDADEATDAPDRVFADLSARLHFWLSVAVACGCTFHGVEVIAELSDRQGEQLAARLNRAYSFVVIAPEAFVDQEPVLSHPGPGNHLLHIGKPVAPAGDETPVEDSSCLRSAEAERLLAIARDAGWLDASLQPLRSRTHAALLADAISSRLGIMNKWKVFEQFWHRKGMKTDLRNAQRLHDYNSLVLQLEKLFR